LHPVSPACSWPLRVLLPHLRNSPLR
jgi:hypothetical protein